MFPGERTDSPAGAGVSGVADEGLARWVAEVRRSAGPGNRVLGADRLRDQQTPASALLLACPNADMTLASPSGEREGHGWGLEAADLRWFVEQWAPDPGMRTDPRLSPLHAGLTGLPPTVIATAGHDPLHDEGRALARRLRAGGTEVTGLDYPGLVHGFLSLGHVSPAAAAATSELFRRFGLVLHG